MASDKPQRAGIMKNTTSWLEWGFHSSSAIIQAVFVAVAVSLERKQSNINAIICRRGRGICSLKFFPQLKHKAIQKSFWFIEICTDWVDIAWNTIQYNAIV